jgi:RES domain-containing protein
VHGGAGRGKVFGGALIAENLSGRFYRILFKADQSRILQGAITQEGRFHHSGQPALYMSPTPETAAIAVATYLRGDDPPRVIAPLKVTNACILDLRRTEVLAHLGLTGTEPSVLWQPQRALGLPATSWVASDAARQTGADGMIYTSRKDPTRWHLVLFRWNGGTDAKVQEDGPAQPFRP